MTDNNEYDGYTKGLIEAIISAANDRSVTFDTLKSKTPVDFLPKKFDGIFPQFLMKIGFTPDGSVLAQSTNDYFYNSIDDVKKLVEKGMYFKWKQKLKEKTNKEILDELTIFGLDELTIFGQRIGPLELPENKKKFISQFLIYIAFELLQYSKNKDWKSCIVKSINTNPENKELKQLERKSSIKEVEKSNENVPLKNPKEYHPIHNGRLFIRDLFHRIRKYIQKALYAVDPRYKHLYKSIRKQEFGDKWEEPPNYKKNTTNLINAFNIIDGLRRHLLTTIQQFTLNKEKEWTKRPTTLGVLSLKTFKHHFFDSAFKREYLLNLMKSPQINASAIIQLKYLENLLKNEDLKNEPDDGHYGYRDFVHRSKMRDFIDVNTNQINSATNPLHQGGRKTRRRRNIRVKSRRYH